MIIYVDIDETICYYEGDRDYSKALPYKDRIIKINRLFEDNTIIYWTARGTLSGKNWFNLTLEQLNRWGCKFHELRMNKPSYDLFIDDKNINSDMYFKEN